MGYDVFESFFVIYHAAKIELFTVLLNFSTQAYSFRLINEMHGLTIRSRDNNNYKV